MSSGALQGQVSVWVPIVVGVLGMVGVIGGQLVNAWREQRREDIRWCREREKEKLQLGREDYLHWREKRLEVSADLMVHLSKCRALMADSLREHHGLVEVDGYVRDELLGALERIDELLAQLELIGTDKMRSLANETVNLFRVRYGLAKRASNLVDEDDIDRFSRELLLKRSDLQELLRGELAVAGP